MHLRILFFGILKEAAGTSEECIEFSAPATIGAVFQAYQQRFATTNIHPSSILVAKNQEFATFNTNLSEGDEVAFLPPVSGGSQSGITVSLTRETIDSGGLARATVKNCDGALVTFEGVARNNTKGRQTRFLEYEAYEPLAFSQLERIASEISRQFSTTGVGVIHRLGRVDIGEASVAIVVSAPHRRPAFEAALDLIDRLKREVPIWKKEFFVDGEVWVEGEWDEDILARSKSFKMEKR